jgi:chemotaxis protein methyltransferase CheR
MLETVPTAVQFDEHEALARLSALLQTRTGLALPQTQWDDLRRAIAAVTAELGLADFRTGIDCLLTATNPQPLQLLIDHLTVGETYFFRDPAVFALLREQLLPTVIQARRASGARHIRIWSAGCSSGEEAYSIAIELKRALPDLTLWQATVLATDINQRFLRKAASGIYDRWSFRDSDPEQRAPYIQRNAEGHYAIAPDIKTLVRFAPLNLMEKIYPSALNGTADIDIIFCRHVLMYLQSDIAIAVLERLCNALVAGGWLLVSNVEAPLVDLPAMTTVRLPNLILFRKETPNAQLITNSLTRSTRLTTALKIAKKFAAPATEKILSPAQRVEAKTVHAQTEQMLVKSPATADNLLALAKTAANQGDFQTALQYCEQALGIDKLNPAAHYLLATILLERNATLHERSVTPDIDATITAENALTRALYLDSAWVMAHIALGNLLLAQPARKARAQRHFDNARALLTALPAQQLVPEAEGLTAGQLLEMINVMSIAGSAS